MKPDRVVIGGDSKRPLDIMREVSQPFLRTFNPLITMDVGSAEMTKYAANCFLATKISFINEISNLCEKAGARWVPAARRPAKASRFWSGGHQQQHDAPTVDHQPHPHKYRFVIAAVSNSTKSTDHRRFRSSSPNTFACSKDFGSDHTFNISAKARHQQSEHWKKTVLAAGAALDLKPTNMKARMTIKHI